MSVLCQGATLRRGVPDPEKQRELNAIGHRTGTGNGLPLRRQLES